MKELLLIPKEIIQQKIYFIRGEKVMFDRDLAELYGVETKVLNQAVKRNKDRFPDDFMFQLSRYEMENWKSQIVTSKGDIKGLRKLSTVFTEQGVAMLSSVLNSKRAIQVNIQIIRTFTQLRKVLATHKDLRDKLEKLEKLVLGESKKNRKYFTAIFETLDLLRKEDETPKTKIGFVIKKSK